MKICSNCGAQNEDVFSKCVACGSHLPITGDEPTTIIEPLDAVQETYNQTAAVNVPNPVYGAQDADRQSYYDNGMNTQVQQGMVGGMPYSNQQGMVGGMPYSSQQGMAGGMPYSSQQGMPGGMPYSNQQTGGFYQPSQPVKANKKAIFIALGAITAVVAIALILVFTFGNRGKGADSLEEVAKIFVEAMNERGADSPEEVAKIFVEAMNERDADKIMTICPPFLKSEKDDIEDTLDELDMYDAEFKYLGVSEKTKCDIEEVEEDIRDYYDVRVSIQDAYDIEVEYDVSMSFDGEDYSETDSDYMLVIKYKGKWYLYE